MSLSLSTLAARFGAALLAACCSWSVLAAPPPLRLAPVANGFNEPTDRLVADARIRNAIDGGMMLSSIAVAAIIAAARGNL